jgi:hypothetical protein
VFHQRARRSALFPKFEADALVAMIENEPVGADDVTDLLLANLKAPDFVRHPVIGSDDNHNPVGAGLLFQRLQDARQLAILLG